MIIAYPDSMRAFATLDEAVADARIFSDHSKREMCVYRLVEVARVTPPLNLPMLPPARPA